MIFFGDLYQLPPVFAADEDEGKFLATHYPSGYFFDAHVFDDLNSGNGKTGADGVGADKVGADNIRAGAQVEIDELRKAYRQQDERFIELLNSVRNGTLTDADLQLLNQRCQPDFVPGADALYVTVTPTNALAARINRERLDLIRQPDQPAHRGHPSILRGRRVHDFSLDRDAPLSHFEAFLAPRSPRPAPRSNAPALPPAD